MKLLRMLGFATGVLLAAAGMASAQSWQPLTHQPSFTAGHALLLTDGTVMVHHEDPNDGFSDWWKLTPDINGSYVNGTWTQLASLSSDYGPLFFASAVLPDGRVIVEGGEQNFAQYVWTNKGEIYNPITNMWTPVSPPSGWTSIGDAQSVVLTNGTFMMANCCTEQQALLNASTMTWTATGSGKFDENDEEGWNLLPGGKVLTVDAYTNIGDPNGKNSEIYNPTTGSWTSAGSTIVQLWDSHGSYEVGPAMLRPDGTVFATGANGAGAGHTSIYNSSNGSWTAWPRFSWQFGRCRWPSGIAARRQRAGECESGHISQWHGFLRVGWLKLESGPGYTQFSRQFVLVRTHASASNRSSSVHRWQQRRRNLHPRRNRQSQLGPLGAPQHKLADH